MAAIFATSSVSPWSVPTAEEWVDTMAMELSTSDRDFARRVLRAWLEMLRDRLSAESVVSFAAQLPESIRAEFLADWNPACPPAKGDATAYTIRFARAAGIAVQEVRDIAPAATSAMMRLMPPSAVYQATDQLDIHLRLLLSPQVTFSLAS